MSRSVANMLSLQPAVADNSGPVEVDLHADTCCAGSNCVIMEYTDKTCNVIGFNRDNPNDELNGIPIVKAATAYMGLLCILRC